MRMQRWLVLVVHWTTGSDVVVVPFDLDLIAVRLGIEDLGCLFREVDVPYENILAWSSRN
jgi:hypothetical protein